MAARHVGETRPGKVSSFTHIEDAVERGPALVGSPERVAEKILDYYGSYQHDLQSVSLNPVLPYEQQQDVLRRFAEEVVPLVRAEVSTTLWGPQDAGRAKGLDRLVARLTWPSSSSAPGTATRRPRRRRSSDPVWDPGYTREIARAHEASGWDHVLFPYASDGPDPAQAAAWAAAHTDRIQLRVAHRPNVSAPTFAAKTFATLDTASGGRVTVHLIAGGLTSDQLAEGDALDKDARYDRLAEYAALLLRSWTSPEPFTHVGPYYRAEEFVLRARSDADGRGSRPAGRRDEPWRSARGSRTCSRSSASRWPRPPTQVDAAALARRRGRPTDAAAADRLPADRRPDRRRGVGQGARDPGAHRRARRRRVPIRTLTEAPREPGRLPENTANLRLAELAASGERHDRALWTPTVAGAGGLPTSATALVGSYRTVADALLDYVDLGFEIFGLRGYDLLADAVEFGENVIPLVHAGVADGRTPRRGGRGRTTLTR